jgi:hypothetical protein
MKWQKNTGMQPCGDYTYVHIRRKGFNDCTDRADAVLWSKTDVVTHYCLVEPPPFDYEEPKAWGLSDYRSHYETCYMLLREWSHIYGSWLGHKEALTIAMQRELSSLPPELSTEAPDGI